MAAPMRATHVKNKIRSFSVFWSRSFIQRQLQTTSHVAEEVYEPVSEEDWPRSKPDAENKDIVLDFFNNCDKVTLKKLFNRKSYSFQYSDAAEIIRRGTISNRFKDFDDACNNVPGLTPKRTNTLAEVIQKLRHDEEQYLGITDLYPELTKEEAQDVDHVVAVEVFQNEIAWAEETRDRTLVSVGHEILIPDPKNYVFNHLKYPQRVAEVLENIPRSSVYLMCQGTSSSLKMASHQAILMQQVILMLNMRSQLGDASFSDHVSVSRMIEQGEIPTRVHMLQMKAINDFYDVLFGREILSQAFKFNHWAKMRRSPFAKLEWSEEIEERLTEGVGRTMMTKCVMMTEMFCRCLNKSNKFPRMYQYT